MLTYYRRADCTRFRTPPIDTGAVQRQIERMFLEAWEHGLSAQDAYKKVLRDADITATLTRQVADNLSFQRAVEVQSITTAAAAERSAYERQRDETLATVQDSAGRDVDIARQQYESIQQTKEQRTAGYTATAARLEELRKRVSDRIAAIGGMEGYHALLEIHGVATDKPDAAKATAPVYAGSPPTEFPAPTQEIAKSTPVSPTASVPSLEQRVAAAPKSERMVKRRGFFQYLKSIFFR